MLPRVVPAVLALLLACDATASQSLYKYRDENGRWVFTDKKPAHKNYEEEQLVATEQHQKVRVVNRGTEERPVLFAVNELAGPVEIWVDFSREQNLRFSQPAPYEWVVDGPGETFLMQFERKDPRAGWAYEWKAGFALGRPIDQANVDRTPFSIPFAGGPFMISQGFHGEESHKQHAHAHYAIDVPMPVNTPILAARDGVVMEVEARFSRSGFMAEYADEANLVRLLHADGTMTVYAHLNLNSIVVVPGQAVKAGQVLGYSGNTGFSTGPHLHFAWQANVGRSSISLPFGFVDHPDEPTRGLLLQGGVAR